MWERPAALFGKDNNTLQLEEFPSLLGYYAFSPAKQLPTLRVSVLPRFSGSSTFWIASHWRQNQYAFPQYRYTFTGQQGVLSKKTRILRNVAVTISNTINQNYIYACFKRRLNLGNACYHLINIFSVYLSMYIYLLSYLLFFTGVKLGLSHSRRNMDWGLLRKTVLLAAWWCSRSAVRFYWVCSHSHQESVGICLI